ncbi:MAG: RNA-binding transcriptional accessory protein [Bacteroidales bacterium]|nr:RNA-binding transcriptional accessory protein [Bacteroidales bacterium]
MNKQTIINRLANDLGIKGFQVSNTVELLEQGATIPFISRYRKEKTGSLDEVAVLAIQNAWKKAMELEGRRETVLKSIEEQGALSARLKSKIEEVQSLTELEDLYLPYKPKRRTRASKARDLGLEPLAKIIMAQHEWNIEERAKQFIREGVEDVDHALGGARDIVAEWISENIRIRQMLRRYFEKEAIITSSKHPKSTDEAEKFSDYFQFSEPLRRCPPHRLLAVFRGEHENQLKVSVQPGQETAFRNMEDILIRAENPAVVQLKKAIRDSYKRLLAPSLETEMRQVHKELADDKAIKVFAENLEQLLLMPPLGQKRILGIDPGFRTGCKLVCIDAQGGLLHNETIYPHPPQNEKKQSARKLSSLVETYKIDAIAIGNGTAGRETEQFVQNYIHFSHDVKVYVVNESGASIYSASPIAREEFPDYDITVRGSVSIGRRLMDPLAELVKIEPKSIGVGQYQHDVDQKKLLESLDHVVEKCVNKVGVHLNTAGKYLLKHISGLGPQLAENIEVYIRENGPFKSRKDLLKVPRMGAKAFEMAAGFLRITDAANPLDNTAVHPERYDLVERMAEDQELSVRELIEDKKSQAFINLQNYLNKDVGLPTLKDIMHELEKPGRDPRGAISIFQFDPNVHSIEDLRPEMILPGIVTNITDFGAFVDIGAKQDGLVHISQLADRYIRHPNEVVKINQQLEVRVLSIEPSRKRIQLSLLGLDK